MPGCTYTATVLYMNTNETVSTGHRWDAMHYVATGEHRCLCGWTPRRTIRDAIAKRAIGSHAASAVRKSANA